MHITVEVSVGILKPWSQNSYWRRVFWLQPLFPQNRAVTAHLLL